MTIQQMMYVAEIARCSSINRAAQNLFVSQSGISIAIGELESELGVKLFIRSNRGAALTPEGREFLSHAQIILEKQEQLLDLYGSVRSGAIGYLSVSSQRYQFAEDAFVSFLGQYSSTQYRFRLTETDLSTVIDNVYNNHSDIGVIFKSELSERVIDRLLEVKGLEFHKVEEIQPCVFLRKNHPLAARECIKPAELEDYPYVTFDNSKSASFELSEELYCVTMPQPRQIIYVNDRATATCVIANTDAVTTGSGLLTEGVTDERWRSIPMATDEKIVLGWIAPHGKQLSPYAGQYVAELTASIRRSIEYTELARKNC